MPHKKIVESPRQLWQKAKWEGFVNVKLSKEEKNQIKNNLISEEACFRFFMDAAVSGNKMSVSYSIPEDVYTVSLTGQYVDKPNAGVTMSIRHRELVVAVSALHFLMEQIGTVQEWTDVYTMSGNDD